MKFAIRATAGLALVSSALLIAAQGAAAEKIESITDLPVHSYPAPVAPSAMLEDADAMDTLAKAVRADVEGMLEDYEIEDAATLKRFHEALVAIALLDGRTGDALTHLDAARELEEKESARLMSGLGARAWLDARASATPGTEAFTAAYRDAYRARLTAMPWDVVQDAIQGTKAGEELRTGNVLRGIVQTNMDAVVAETGELSDEMAEGLLKIHLALRDFLPLRDVRIALLQELVDAHQEEKPDIWPARSVTLDPDAGHARVVVGIWDSGVDVNVFGDQVWTNEDEVYNGLDDDGNGFVDDIHGIAYDMFGARHPELLHPAGDMTGRVDEAMQYAKGLSDLQAAIDSPEASELKQYIGSLEPSEVRDFITALGFTALYMHGTHVAGIAVEGNPYAEILCARIAFDYHPQPAPILLQSAEQHARSYAETVAYFQAAGVRVVNMSWGWTFKEVLASLEANGIGGSAEERKAMTEEIFGTLDRGLHDAIASAPGILFVIAAGNDDSDVGFDRTIPSSYELDNILVVGAVDQAGERTSFTSMGDNVVVYANGFEVESFIPGGERLAASGTSMASPNAANLAAKLVALEQELRPREIVSLIEEGADALPGAEGLKLLNPAASVALLEARQNASK